MTEDIPGLDVWKPGHNSSGDPANRDWFGRRELLDSRYIPRACVNQARVRIERDRHSVRSARRPDFHLFPGQEAFVYVRQDRATRLQVDLRGPIDLDIRVRDDEFAVRAVHNVQEA